MGLSEEERAKREQNFNPFEKLEKERHQRISARSSQARLKELEHRSAQTNKWDYQMNRQLRVKNRLKRRQEEGLAREGTALGLNPHIKLQPKSEGDVKQAANTRFHGKQLQQKN